MTIRVKNGNNEVMIKARRVLAIKLGIKVKIADNLCCNGTIIQAFTLENSLELVWSMVLINTSLELGL